MPALDDVLSVLEHNLHKSPVVSAHHGRVKDQASASWVVGDRPDPEDTGDAKVVGDLEWGVFHGMDEGNAIDSIPLLAADYSSRADELDRAAHVDLPIVVGALRVRPRPARRQISPAMQDNKTPSHQERCARIPSNTR